MKQDLYSPDRIKEFFALVESLGKLPNRKYFTLNREKILEEIEKEENKMEYPLAYKLITSDKENIFLSFEEKAIELFKYVENRQRMISLNEKIKFSNQDNMYSFWNDRKKDIINYFIDSNYKDVFPYFYNIIINYLARTRIKSDIKLQMFFDYVSLDNGISPERNINPKQNMLQYWYINKELLYFMALSEHYNSIYPIVCEIIKNQYISDINDKNIESNKKRMN